MIDPSEKAAVGSFEKKLYQTAIKMLKTAHNYTGQLFASVHLVVSMHEDDADADMTALFGYDGKFYRFENIGTLKLQDPNNTKRLITFDVTEEKMSKLYENLGAGVADLRLAFGDSVRIPEHMYMTALIAEDETTTRLEYFHEEDESDHSAVVASWLVELEEGEVAFFQNITKKDLEF